MKQNRIGWGLYVLALLSSAALILFIWRHGLLPTSYRWVGLCLAVVFLAVLGGTVYKRPRKAWKRGALNLFLILFTLGTAFTTWYAQRGVGTIEAIHGKQGTQTVEFSLVANKDSKVVTIQDIHNTAILAALAQDAESIRENLSQMEQEWKLSLQTEDVKDYLSGASRILNDTKAVLLLNESYRPLIEERTPEFSQKTRVVSPVVELTRPAEKNREKTVGEAEPFLVYVSGVDSRGSLYAASRSDVNIVMAVNPKTKQIAMLSVPRDSYVPIAGGGNDQYDKLTHAGIYGVQSSIQTLENLLDLSISYYAKINFTALVELVDVLGGIDIYNDQEFTSLHGRFFYPKGELRLNGEKALSFARERYALQGGDIDRGENQLKVLQAMIEKALSPSIAFNYGQVLRVAEESMDMNMPKSKIVELINGQIEHPGKWRLETVRVRGEATSGLPSYAMPGYDLYMYPLNEESVKEAGQALRAVLE